ncbi:dihydroxy-acid dehydratase [Nonomuraea sp. NBC_00507]|uniref:dihydroxy-acid dehydratase domain-containing protein n=1 Tax=Nonomuraea sp. NBC_00507 TaxID=2976002 RepID=UPI002E1855A3
MPNIAHTASDLTPCNSHLNEVAQSVMHGEWEAGGVPLNLPVVSLGETNVRPTAMLWRNLAAMAAASVDLPAVVVPGGPMLTGHFRALRSAAAPTCGGSAGRCAGTLSREAFLVSESFVIRSRGHCNTMGTASTMARSSTPS